MNSITTAAAWLVLTPSVSLAAEAGTEPAAGSWLPALLAATALAILVLVFSLWLRRRREVQRLRALVDGLPFDLWVCDEDGRYTFQNATSRRKRGDQIGREPDDVVLDRQTLAQWREHRLNLPPGEWVVTQQSRIVDGERVSSTKLLRPVVGAGDVPRLTGINLDVPELGDALRAAHEPGQRESVFRSIFEGSPEGIVTTDTERRINMVNAAFSRLFGYSEQEVIGRDTRFLYADPREYEQVGEDYQNREPGDGLVGRTYQVRMCRKDGEAFFAETVTDLLFDPDGAHVGYVGFIRDTSDRMVFEAEYRDIFENVHEGLCRSTPDGKILRANPALVRMFGYESEGALLYAIEDLGEEVYVDPEDRVRMVEKVREHGSVEGLEVEMYRPGTGERIWVRESAHGMFDEHGELEALDVTLEDITQRREAELMLRQQEERYRMLVESSSAIFWEGDPDTMQFTFVSREAESLLGYPVEAWTESPDFWVEHMHPEDRQWAPEFCIQASRDRREHEFDYRMITADGRTLWLHDIVKVIVDEGGKARNVGVMIDITEAKEAERELARNEARYRELYERTPVMLHTIDRDGRLTAVSGYWLEHLGYQREEVLGRQSTDFLTEASRRQALEEDLPRFIREGEIHEVPFQFVKANGEVIDVLLSAVGQYNEEGKLERGLGVVTDVTERKRAESRLREAAAVFANTADGVFITDAEGNTRDVNRAFTEITGFRREEVVDQNPRLWKSERHDTEFYRTMWRSLERDGHWRGEIWNRRKDGATYPAWLTISQVLDDEGNLSGYVAVFSDISNIKDAEARLDHLAHHDPLTDLPNRILLNDRLSHAITRASRSHQSLAVIFIDLDRFKHVNDSFGHTLGDSLLQKVAGRLSQCVRADDTVARIGGDEFILLLEDVSEEQGASIVADKVLGAFSTPLQINDHEIFVTPSLGIAVYPSNGEDADTLLRNADAAMYQAKQNGGNTFAFYTQALTERAFERVRLEGSLRRALEREEFSLMYQPQVDMISGAMLGAEALLRWEHPEQGMVRPDRFIPFAEETGMIIPIGEWVLRQACLAASAWREAGLEIGRVSVNVAGPQLRRGGLVEAVEAALEGARLPPDCLELEVTEGFIMERAEYSLKALEALRDLGVRLAIDDFGTGYSSLGYLKRLPIDVLKIDQSFVRETPDDASNVGICKAVIALAGNLDLEVIAEGVETPAQRDFLIASGCINAQGYLFSRPLPVDELREVEIHTAQAGAAAPVDDAEASEE